MSEWVDGDEAMVSAQYPLSAMATVDLIRGNLERAYDMSAWQIQVSSHQQSEASVAITDADEWVDLPGLGRLAGIPITVRRDRSGWRGIKVAMEAKTSAGTATIRAHVFGGLGALEVDPSEGYTTGYAEVITDSSTYEWKSDTITGAEIAEHVWMEGAPDEDATAPDTMTAAIALVWVVSASEAATVSVRSIALSEVIA